MNSWEDQVARFWRQADDADPDVTLETMKRLVELKPQGNPDALYEMASVHDFLGNESAAIPLYREALAAGLSAERRPQAIVQLASSLRNVGEADEAVTLLSDADLDPQTRPGARAFLALALRDCGRGDEALRVALLALAETLPLYGRSIRQYAEELTGPK